VPQPTLEDVEDVVHEWLGSSAFEGLDAVILVEAGDPLRTITEQSVARAVDLIVMGTHGRRDFDRLLSGSVTERVLRASGCPVLAVPPGLATATSATSVFHRILCAVDFSLSSRRALNIALDFARQGNGTVTVVTVVEWLAEEEPRTLAHFNVSAYRRHLLEDTRSRLHQLLSAEARTWCDIDEVVTFGRAHRQVLRLAAERCCDLVVMGAQGRGGPNLSSFGSTTPPVVRSATVPVLVVRGPGGLLPGGS
jgi:nucleotide-binding universal stress UspA family protein